MLNLKGYRTHIVNAVRGSAYFALIAGYQVDPELVIGFLDDLWAAWLAGEAALTGLVHYFRSRANEKV